ncbi:high mobility group B protein 10-like [Tasmannia lanceolata]|uniref:high mobility group B protein 10-like n=1 Tax=Tasmannia lanceolata TaxID=3420 RepID=UPI00406426A2
MLGNSEIIPALELSEDMENLEAPFGWDLFSPTEDVSQNLDMHESLIEKEESFYDKLYQLQEWSGRKLIAIVEDTVLDLYVFYKEVTSRGGLDQVIKERRWNEVASSLNLTDKIPDPSFLLQEFYVNNLYLFEQMYFRGTKGEPVTPPGSLMAPNLMKESSKHPHSSNEDHSTVKRMHDNKCIPVSAGPLMEHNLTKEASKDPHLSNVDHSTVKRKHQNSCLPLSAGDPQAHVGKIVKGAIETKFNNGYLITVKVGPEKLDGLLYHAKEGAVEQFANVPGLIGGVTSDFNSEPEGLQIRVMTPVKQKPKTPVKQKPSPGPKKETKRKDPNASKKETKRKDPNAPRKTRNAYQFYFSEHYDQLKKMRQSLDGSTRTMVIDAWKRLSESERMPYIEESRKDRERYNKEMAAYEQLQKVQVREEEVYRPYYPLGNVENYLQTESQTSEFLVPYDFMSQTESAEQMMGSFQMGWEEDFFGSL